MSIGIAFVLGYLAGRLVSVIFTPTTDTGGR